MGVAFPVFFVPVISHFRNHKLLIPVWIFRKKTYTRTRKNLLFLRFLFVFSYTPVSFKKTKLHREETTEFPSSFKKSYFAIKRRNLLSGMLLGFLGIAGVVGVSLATFSHLPNFQFNFSLPFSAPFDLFETVTGTEPGKINILLTGIGGRGHDGADLTDTILFASLNRDAKTIAMLSIPRDLYVEYPLTGRGKINEIYMR